MGSLWLPLTFLAALAATPPPMAPPLPLPPTIGVNLVDPEGATPFPLEGVQAEVERLFAPLGVRVVRGGADDGSVQVVVLGSDRSRGGLNPRAMGSVARNPQLSPVVWIVAPNVRRTLGGTPQRWPVLPVALLARALGRIVAHEIVHLIAPDLPHAESGLMSVSLGRAQLLRDGVALDPALGSTVRGRLATGRLRPPPA
jgi:hypothetical protein